MSLDEFLVSWLLFCKLYPIKLFYSLATPHKVAKRILSMGKHHRAPLKLLNWSISHRAGVNISILLCICNAPLLVLGMHCYHFLVFDCMKVMLIKDSVKIKRRKKYLGICRGRYIEKTISKSRPKQNPFNFNYLTSKTQD